MKREEAIRNINRMIRFYEYPSAWYMMAKRDLEMDSYVKWAAREVRDYVVKHPEKPVTEAVEDFRIKMDQFSCSSKKSLQSFIFSVAYDTTTEILDMLIGGK